MAVKLLVVDDEKDILEFLKYNLEANNYIVETAQDGVSALKKLRFAASDRVRHRSVRDYITVLLKWTKKNMISELKITLDYLGPNSIQYVPQCR